MGFTDAFSAILLNNIFGGVAVPSANLPATVYVGLHVGGTAPNLTAGTGVSEPSTTGTNYARYPLARNTTNFPANTVVNAADTQDVYWAGASINGTSTLAMVNRVDSNATYASAALQFNISAIPTSNITINSAQMYLYAARNTAITSAVNSIAGNVYRITTAWTESSGQISGYVTSGDAVEFNTGVTSTTFQWVNIDITSIVKSWIEQGVTNNGVYLTANTGAGPGTNTTQTNYQFQTREASSNQPYIQIDYSLTTIKNAPTFTFNKASADWGTATHLVMYDAATAGNIIEIFPLTSSVPILNGDTPRFSPNNFSVSATA